MKKKLLEKLRFRQYSTHDILAVGVPALLLVIAAFYFAAQFIRPAPPRQLTLSTGPTGGAYESFGLRYRDFLAQYGVELILKPSAGSTENLQRLRAGEVDAGFVQSGSAEISEGDTILSLASLYPEPLWIFYRADAFKTPPTRFTDLRGKRIAIGGEGSGTRQLALALLGASGIDGNAARLSPLGGQEAIEQFQNRKLDVVMTVGTAHSATIWQLLYNADARLMNLREAEAYTRSFAYLTLPEGGIDFILPLPAHDIEMVAPSATLLVSENLHPALADLLMWAASDIHRQPDIFQRPNEFPHLAASDVPVSPAAERFFKNGKPFLQRYLPFWAATLIDRLFVLLIPLIAILIPLFKVAPSLYGWRIRSRIHKNYGELKLLDTELGADPDSQSRDQWLAQLADLEARVNALPTPLAYAQEVYTLRSHIELVRHAILSERTRDRMA